MVSKLAVVLLAFAAVGLVKGATETVDWGFNTYEPLELTAGDSLTFNWGGFHDVAQIAAAECGSKILKQVTIPKSGGSATVVLDKAGTYHFQCTVGAHCASGGMLLTVNVAEPPLAKAWAIGSKQIPPVKTTAVAWTTIATLNDTHYRLKFTVTKPIKNFLYAHIHAGNKTESGPVILQIAPTTGAANPPITGTLSTSFVFDASRLAGEYANNRTKFQGALDYRLLYVNVHTTQNPAGEIRGQLHYNP